MSTIYDEDMLDRAASRGYDHEAHLQALQAQDEDAITVTHPANWLTEFEVEVCSTLDQLIADGLVTR